ncbi:heavy-metal-associated domain-containing protein [Actinomycetospora straminea]|uniref:HMA domain-containing protein n=1 Tax=Actinomycetospora straminea TaxID=663607 RepID=A0ABP9DZQ0_9PSEU
MSAPPAAPTPQHVELAISGMTCASCAARIERRLTRLDGVRASVNYATATATVEHPATMPVDDLVATVEELGYGAAPPAPPAEDTDADTGDTDPGFGGAGMPGMTHPLSLAAAGGPDTIYLEVAAGVTTCVFVVGNSLRLRRFTPRGARRRGPA